ncbi:hypothetical protein GCM10022226_44130 [Sphaerisporangium flaviroseum]|uniref:Uncharacterized protein n=1 Tax=Sphaerisporangium flaviroseum TaxID=509199 RepID=A0ABP7IHQ8_9ACTN
MLPARIGISTDGGVGWDGINAPGVWNCRETGAGVGGRGVGSSIDLIWWRPSRYPFDWGTRVLPTRMGTFHGRERGVGGSRPAGVGNCRETGAWSERAVATGA